MELISREEAINRIEEAFDMGDCYCDKFALRGIFKSLPTVEERKEGYWIDADEINEQLDTYLANCSVCNCQMDVHENRGYFKFCPNCGAKMQSQINTTENTDENE